MEKKLLLFEMVNYLQKSGQFTLARILKKIPSFYYTSILLMWTNEVIQDDRQYDIGAQRFYLGRAHFMRVCLGQH